MSKNTTKTAEAQGAEAPKNLGAVVSISQNTPAVIKKPALNLEQTLKLVEDLHLKKRHRDNLEHSIDTLNDFEIEKRQEDLDDRNHYQGCTLKITDDKRNEFAIKNPVIIAEVVEFLKSRFLSKLAEIEAQIVLPVA